MKTSVSLRAGGCLLLSALTFAAIDGVQAAEQIKDPYHPTVNGSPVTLMKDNMITQALGGRLVDLDVWVGEFFKYDDNIFNTAHDKEVDTIWSTAGGFKLEANRKDVWKLRLEGQLQYNAYGKNTEYNGFEGYFHSKGEADFSPALGARVSLNYDNTYDNMRDEEEIFTLHQYSASGGVSLRPSPFAGVDVDYTFFGQRREDERLERQNYDEHSVAVRPYYDITPNTTIYLQMSGSNATPIEDIYNTSQMLTALLGAAWHYRDTANVFAEAGVKYMYFDDNGRISDDEDDVTRPAFRLGGSLGLNEDWRIGVVGSWMPQYSAVTTDASNSNYIDRAEGRAYLSYSPGAGRFTATLAPFYRYTRPSNDDEYQQYGGQISVSYSFTDWFNVNASYRHTVTEYEDEDAYGRNVVTVGIAATF